MSSVKISELAELREKILRFRASHNLSQAEFAEMCGLTRPTVGAIESGGYRRERTTVSEITKMKILNCLEKFEKGE